MLTGVRCQLVMMEKHSRVFLLIVVFAQYSQIQICELNNGPVFFGAVPVQISLNDVHQMRFSTRGRY